jgi:hypothetical protein
MNEWEYWRNSLFVCTAVLHFVLFNIFFHRIDRHCRSSPPQRLFMRRTALTNGYLASMVAYPPALLAKIFKNPPQKHMVGFILIYQIICFFANDTTVLFIHGHQHCKWE